jgi:hypothetical protein
MRVLEFVSCQTKAPESHEFVYRYVRLYLHLVQLNTEDYRIRISVPHFVESLNDLNQYLQYFLE